VVGRHHATGAFLTTAKAAQSPLASLARGPVLAVGGPAESRDWAAFATVAAEGAVPDVFASSTLDSHRV
jgi:hypothetical protein